MPTSENYKSRMPSSGKYNYKGCLVHQENLNLKDAHSGIYKSKGCLHQERIYLKDAPIRKI